MFFFSLACYAIYMILFLSYEQYSDWDEFGYVDSDFFLMPILTTRNIFNPNMNK